MKLDPLVLLYLIVGATLLFEFANGWNDAANSIATIVSTRVLTPLLAVVWAATWNFIAAFAFGTEVAKTMGKGLVDLNLVNEYVLLGGLLGAIIWTSVCTWMGLPISVSHSLMGGYGGAAIAKAGFDDLEEAFFSEEASFASAEAKPGESFADLDDGMPAERPGFWGRLFGGKSKPAAKSRK